MRFEQDVEFVSPEQLQVAGANGISTAEGQHSDGKVLLNSAMPAERLTGYLIKHELTHSIERTKQWAQLEQIVWSYYGDAAFEEAKAEVMRRYAANNTQLTPEGAAREVVAQWVGENLFRDGFAQAISSGDASVGNAFLQTLDKIRLALGGTKNSRTAGNIALVERLFMRALEGEKNSQNTGEQYAIVALDNGKIYVQADRKILSGTDKEVWKSQIDDFFDKVLLKNGSLTVKSVEGDILTITKDNTVWKGKDEHVLENGLLRFLRKDEYRVKFTALSHIDELAEASRVQRNKDGSRRVEPDTKNHPFAKDGFEYRTVFFQDFDGKYYRIALSVGLADGISTVYSIGVTKETTVPDASIISAIGSKAQGTIVSNTKIAQNSFGVNSYDMQNPEKNSQFSFPSIDIEADEDATVENGTDEPYKNARETEETGEYSDEGMAEVMEQLEQIVRSYYGDAAFEEAKAEVTRRYAANNTQLTPEGAAREVVAQWVGENLFRDGFAQAIASGDASVGGVFLQTLDKIRLALGGTKNSRTAGNIALVERLFMRALESGQDTRNAQRAQNTAEQYAIVALDNGKIYVQADRNILSGTNKEVWKSQIDTFFDNVLLTNGSLTVESVEGDTLTITKEKTVWKGKDEHVQIGGNKRPLAQGQYYIKLTALSHIDELSEASFVHRNQDGSRKVYPDQKNHPFAKDGFEYRTVFFQDFNGKYYRITMSVGLADDVSTIYNIGKIKETEAPEGEIISACGSKAQGASVSNTTVAQNSFGVNTYDMQNEEKNSQFSFPSIDIEADDDATAENRTDEPYKNAREMEETGEYSGEGNSQAIPNLNDTPDMDTVMEEDSENITEQRQAERQESEEAPSRENERKKVAQGKTLEELEQELSERELFNRAYMSEVIDRPPRTVEIGGQEVDSAAYMDMVEDSIPDTEEGIEAFMEDVSGRRASEIVRQYEETGEVGEDTTAAELQVLAADRKLTRIRLSEGEEDGKLMRRFFEQRLKNLDANRTHADEMVEYLAGRDERYNPISNQKTLEKAKMRLKDRAYALKLERRIKHHREIS